VLNVSPWNSIQWGEFRRCTICSNRTRISAEFKVTRFREHRLCHRTFARIGISRASLSGAGP
jgi:hypothetical protein